MHIPDGYLSPSTCATLYVAATPFWYTALKRAQRIFRARAVPLLGMVGAFSFVIMMFNLPLPGGTTGHAVGMGMASIILGPWVSMLAISMALLVQALFFGDGGISTFGANCFNMAIVGSVVAYATYRLIARGATLTSRRRIVAAATAGYCAINVSALCAAIEFGIQPALFHDRTGTPLYAPYPLSVSIPAMMIGHLAFAGLAELVISGGVVSYLQRSNPEALRLTAPDAPAGVDARIAEEGLLRPVTRKLWMILAITLFLTPLGILTVGSAWGEWSARDFITKQGRSQIGAVSFQSSPPEHAPQGLERLSSLWRPVIPQYAPGFIRNPYFGYILSAATGAGLVILLGVFTGWLARKLPARSGKRHPVTFVEKTTATLVSVIQSSLFAEDIAGLVGFLQSLDARVKLAGITALLLATVSVARMWALSLLLAIGIGMAIASHVPLLRLAKRLWIPLFAFTAVIAAPAIFLVPGSAILTIPWLDWSATQQGLTSVCILILRAETAATFGFLLVSCTRWNRLLRALRFFKIPAAIILLLEITYRYIFVLLRVSQDVLESRRARIIGRLEPDVQRRLAAATIGVLLDKSLQLSGEVHLSMQARGFRGEVRLLDDLTLGATDWMKLAGFVAVAAALTLTGR